MGKSFTRVQSRHGHYEGQTIAATTPGGLPVQHGFGVLTASDRSSVAGAWSNGRCLRGVCVTCSGSVFEGDFSWYGTLTSPQGKVYRGRWQQGKLVQKGVVSRCFGRCFAFIARVEAHFARKAAGMANEQDGAEESAIEQGRQNATTSVDMFKIPKKKEHGPPRPPMPRRFWVLCPLTFAVTTLWGTHVAAAWDHSWLAVCGLIAALFGIMTACALISEQLSSNYSRCPYLFGIMMCMFWFAVYTWTSEVMPPLWADHSREAYAFMATNFVGTMYFLYVSLCDPGYVPKTNANGLDLQGLSWTCWQFNTFNFLVMLLCALTACLRRTSYTVL